VKLTTEELDTRELLVRVELDKEQTDKALHQAAKVVSREITIPGFRKGKAPYEIVVRYVGENIIYEAAVEEIADELYKQILKELEIKPFGRASIEDFQKDPFVITYKIPLPPEVDLGDYRSIRIEPEEVEITQEDVDRVLQNIQFERAVWKSVDRPAQYDDLLVLDMNLKIGNESFQEIERNLYLSKDAELLPGLNEELVGLAPGESKEFTLRYWENAESRFAGKEVKVSVKVHEVKERELPPIDDEFAASVGDYESLEELEEDIRSSLLEEYQKEAEDRYLNRAIEALMASATVKFPPVMLDLEIRDMLEDFDESLRERGLSLERYLRQVGKTREELAREMKPEAEDRIKYALVIRKFIEEEGIEVSDEEVEAKFKELKKEHRLREMASSPSEAKEEIRHRLLVEKALERLVRIAKGELEIQEAPSEEAASPAAEEPSEGSSQENEETGGES